MHKIRDNLKKIKKSYEIMLSAMCIYFIFIEMFEDYWNYNYHTLPLFKHTESCEEENCSAEEG